MTNRDSLCDLKINPYTICIVTIGTISRSVVYNLYMPETRSTIGRFEIERERVRNAGFGTTYSYSIVDKHSDWRVQVGDDDTGYQLARTLAATLDAAEIRNPDEIMPPEWGARGVGGGDEWESWVGESKAVPGKIAAAGKAPLAGWLKVVHKERASWIANEIGVAEQTVKQYLSDLREGRR